MSKAAAKPSAIDLFSGCGGLTLGLKSAGFRVAAAADLDALASSTYRRNHRSTLHLQRDVQAIDPTRLMHDLGMRAGELGLLAGCPPCQGFSSLRTLNGSRNVAEPMNDLVFQFLRFAKVFRPKSVMIENVPGLALDDRIKIFEVELHKLDYQLQFDVFDAAQYGVPQRRRRMILIALHQGAPEFAPAERRKRAVVDAIGEMHEPGQGNDPAHDYVVRRADHVMDLIRRVPKDGGSRSDLGKDAQLPCHIKCDGFKDIYGRMAWNKPAPTITGGCINPSKGRFLHPDQDRAITLREAALLQGFPKRYHIDMSRGRYPAAQMIGNAFPPKFAAVHAKRILATLD